MEHRETEREAARERAIYDGRWVPVSERLPDTPHPMSHKDYFVTLTVEGGGHYWQERAMWIYDVDGCRWSCEKGEGYPYPAAKVVAWMPIPEYTPADQEGR